MKALFKLIVVATLVLFFAGSVYAGKKDPVGVLFQASGQVEYTKNGQTWKKVRRSKFLFAGYQVKTGPGSTASVTMNESGLTMTIGPDSLIAVTGNKLTAKSGNLETAESSNKLLSGLMNKFSKAQSYTTVRRSHKKKTVKIAAVRNVALTDEYPFIVWNNVGPEYNYQLEIGETAYNVPATGEPIVRVKVEPFAGEKDYKIIVLKDGMAVVELKPYKSRGKHYPHTVSWIEGQQKSDIHSKILELQESFGEDSFVIGSYFEKQDMWVAAMDQYQRYLNENPDELELTPYLFRVYKKLKLDDVYNKELEAWKAATIE
ncbi:MAG: hypothetical protein ABIK68_03965 [bacterium]